MAILQQLQEMLDAYGVPYQVLTHQRVYSTQRTAACQHIPGKDMAKVVMVKQDDRSVMTVLPASHRVNFSQLQAELGGQVRLEGEQEFRMLFPHCETGAEPPFGNLFGLEVWVDRTLTEDEEIVFNAGTHCHAVRMRYADFAWLVQPQVAAFAQLTSARINDTDPSEKYRQGGMDAYHLSVMARRGSD